jgi:spermidine synthase
VGLQAVSVVYAVGIVFILWALKLRPLLVGGMAVVTAGWLVVLPTANLWSNALWYVQVQGLPEGTSSLFSGYSPYQKVDVLESPSGTRYLYLDSLEHFGSADTHRLDVIGGQIPASIVWPPNALVVGAGSMEMAALIADYAGHVTTVEIDPMVVDASLNFFEHVNRMNALDNRTVVTDDAKHFLANDAMEYNLIAAAPPAAYSLQTATLYSLPFYQTVHDRLAFDGVFVANMTSDFGPDDLVSRRIAAGLLMTFDDVIVVTAESVGWSFAYASDNLPFGVEVVEAALRQSGETHYAIFDTPAVRALTGDAQPITLDTMDIVLHVSLDYIENRLR